jgi:hypothetical protein
MMLTYVIEMTYSRGYRKMRGYEQEKKSQMCPCQLSTAAGWSVRHVLAGGEVTGGEEQALHNLQDLLISMVGDVHKNWGWSMASDEDWRRP